MLTKIGYFLFNCFAIMYIPMIFLSAGWNYHRACSMKVSFDRGMCTLASGVAWPIFNGIEIGIWVMDPERINNVPNIHFDWKDRG